MNDVAELGMRTADFRLNGCSASILSDESNVRNGNVDLHSLISLLQSTLVKLSQLSYQTVVTKCSN